jgi:GH18 family chitinase
VLQVDVEPKDKQLQAELQAKKRSHSNLKTLISIGGYSFSVGWGVFEGGNNVNNSSITPLQFLTASMSMIGQAL